MKKQLKEILNHYHVKNFNHLPIKFDYDNFGDLTMVVPILYNGYFEEAQKEFSFLWHCSAIIINDTGFVKIVFYRIKYK